MRRKELWDIIRSHGGIKAIHVRPHRGGWANTIVCADGFTRTLNKSNEAHVLAAPAGYLGTQEQSA